MARAVCLSAVVVLACLAAANAQGCIECKDCQGSNFCLSQCKQSCGVDVEQCKSYGWNSAKDVAKFACDLTLNYCNAPTAQPKGAARSTMVTLQQCGNAAYGVCQSVANDPKQSPCGNSFNGVAKCDRTAFQNFYNGVVNEQCNKKAAVFDVQPKGL